LPQVAASLIRLRPLLPHVLDDIEKGPHLQTEHALISLNNTLQGCLENALSMAEAQMNVVMTGSEFLTVFAAASTAPLIIAVPTRLASRYGPMFGLTPSPVPLDLDITSVSMIWSAQSDRDPASHGCGKGSSESYNAKSQYRCSNWSKLTPNPIECAGKAAGT